MATVAMVHILCYTERCSLKTLPSANIYINSHKANDNKIKYEHIRKFDENAFNWKEEAVICFRKAHKNGTSHGGSGENWSKQVISLDLVPGTEKLNQTQKQTCIHNEIFRNIK